MGNKLQREIMVFIDEWVNENDFPISRSSIVSEMVSRGFKGFTVSNSLNSLQKKGFIKKSSVRSNKTSYIQLKSI